MAKKALGKGLGALLASTLAEEDAGTVREIPIKQISPNPFQPRKSIDPAKLTELAESVREHGVLQPLIVTRVAVDSYELVAGERRMLAAREAGLRTVPAVVRDYDTLQVLEVALIENLQREDIGPMEAASAYQRLRAEFGLTQDEIARRVGKAQSTVANTLRLLTLPAPIMESLGRGEITEGHARAILQTAPKARLAAWKRIKKGGLSVREAESMARDGDKGRGKEGKSGRGDDGKTNPAVAERDPNLAAMEEELRAALGTKVTLKWSGEVGKLEIEFYSQDHLESVVERLTRNL